MLDSETAKRLEDKVFERMNLNQLKDSGTDSLTKMISKIAVRATIITLQEHERLNSETHD